MSSSRRVNVRRCRSGEKVQKVSLMLITNVYQDNLNHQKEQKVVKPSLMLLPSRHEC